MNVSPGKANGSPKGSPSSGFGDGSIYTDKTKPGRYFGMVDVGRDPDGRRVRRKVSGATEREVKVKLRKLLVARDEGRLRVEPPKPVRSPGAGTGDWLAFWLDDILPGTVAENTAESYRQIVKDWIAPYVATIPLEDLAPEHVVAMMRALERRGLSATTQKKARTILRRALTVAERYGRVSRNVAALTDAPKDAGQSVIDDALDADEAAKVLEAAKGDRLEALAVLVLAVGVRQGEALDLRWSDLDLDAGTMTVYGTKSTASDRRVALPLSSSARCAATRSASSRNGSPRPCGATRTSCSPPLSAPASTAATPPAGGTS